MVARSFGNAIRANGSAKAARRPPEVHGGLVMKKKSLEQVHLCLGLKGVAAGHRDRYAAYALNSVLGGSMSSRLFQEVREKRGLVYSIYSFLSGYSDVGTITVYAATRPKEVERVVDLVCREIRRIGKQGIEQNELDRAKNQMKGSLMLSLESSHSRMSKLAKDELIYGSPTSLEEMLAHIDRVTTAQANELGRQLFNVDALAITGLGPLSSRTLQAYR